MEADVVRAVRRRGSHTRSCPSARPGRARVGRAGDRGGRVVRAAAGEVHVCLVGGARERRVGGARAVDADRLCGRGRSGRRGLVRRIRLRAARGRGHDVVVGRARVEPGVGEGRPGEGCAVDLGAERLPTLPRRERAIDVVPGHTGRGRPRDLDRIRPGARRGRGGRRGRLRRVRVVDRDVRGRRRRVGVHVGEDVGGDLPDPHIRLAFTVHVQAEAAVPVVRAGRRRRARRSAPCTSPSTWLPAGLRGSPPRSPGAARP